MFGSGSQRTFLPFPRWPAGGQGHVRIAGVSGRSHAIELRTARPGCSSRSRKAFPSARAQRPLSATSASWVRSHRAGSRPPAPGPWPEETPSQQDRRKPGQPDGNAGAIGQDVKGVRPERQHRRRQGREKLDEIVDNIRVLTAEFRAMAQENHSAINTTLANVEAISGDLRDRLPRLAQQFEDLGAASTAWWRIDRS